MMSPHPLRAFTAAQIAGGLQKSSRALRSALEHVTPTSLVLAAGHQTKAWSIADLPARLREQLTAAAQTGGYRSAEQLLANPPAPWQPAFPLVEVADHALESAAKLQRALQPMLARLNDLTLTEAEFAAQGVAQYQQVFGHSISDRYWRKLWTRTLTRDGGAENWARLEIFLDEAPARKAPAATGPTLVDPENHDLFQLINAFKNPLQPTPAEVELLWTYAFESLETRTAAGAKPKKAKRSLLNFLWAFAPFLADNANGLRKQFERKQQRWIDGGKKPSAVADQRREKSGNFRGPELSQADKDLLVGHSVLFHGGRVGPAWRELTQAGELSQDLTAHYLHNPASKSHVPRRIRDAVSTDVALLEDIHHGPRQAKLNGAHIHRDWTGVYSGDWYQADDCTLPIYYFEPDGKGWYTLWRGQFLLMIDVRSLRILGYALLSSRNYNALAIRTLVTRTCDAHGLPRKGFYFENGIWKSAKILTGDKSPLSLPEAEKGLRDLGLRFVHAKLPRSKPVERVLGMMQDLMEGYPGYAGRDERHDRFERIQKLKLQVESRKLEPEGHFLSAERWLDCLDELCQKYNAATQEGKMLAGLNPEDAWHKLDNAADPQVKFDASCRYLLAHHRKPVKVTGNGITLHFGKKVFNYRNEHTGRLIGQTVLTWFNPEAPEIISVTDQDRQNPFAVARTQEIPAMDATPAQMKEEMGRIAAHQEHAKAYYRTLQSKFARNFRRNLLDGRTSALGDAFTEQQTAVRQETQQAAALDRRDRKVSGKLHAPLSRGTAHQVERVEAKEELERLFSDEKDQA